MDSEQLTTYRAQGKTIGLVFLFQYCLKGHLKAFKVEEGELNPEQMEWLFTKGNFPAYEAAMKDIWMKWDKYKKLFKVEISPPDLSFNTLWSKYNLKVKKDASEKAFNKLNQADKIKCFIALKDYENHLKNSGQAKAHLVTWINGKRFNDEY